MISLQELSYSHVKKKQSIVMVFAPTFRILRVCFDM